MNFQSSTLTRFINLDQSKHKLEHMTKVLKDSGIYNYKRFSAVDGRNLEIISANPYLVIPYSDKIFVNPIHSKHIRLSRGEIGASLSHLLVYLELLSDPIHEKYLIL